MEILRLPRALRSVLVTHAFGRRLVSTTSNELISWSDIGEHVYERQQPPPPLSPSPILALNSYQISNPPTPPQVKQADAFFSNPPTLLYSAKYFRQVPPSPFPEVAFLGCSNVGKSSLLNALLGRPNDKPAHISKRPGKTKTMNGFGVGGQGLIGAEARVKKNTVAVNTAKGPFGSDPLWKRFGQGGLVLMDMPGYGSGSRDDWGPEILKYLENRKQLRKTYLLVVAEHGLKKHDITLLLHLREREIPYQIVLTKVDKLLNLKGNVTLSAPKMQKLHNTFEKLRRQLRQEVQGRDPQGEHLLDMLACSAETKTKHGRLGVDELRWSILTACGLESAAKQKHGQKREKLSEDSSSADFTPIQLEGLP